jgi:hypothetical protein
MKSLIQSISDEFEDKNIKRMLRLAELEGITKSAQILDTSIRNVMTHGTSSFKQMHRGGEVNNKLYDLAPEREKADNKVHDVSRSLSTRYSPDRVGVMARRIADGVYQDPYTNKVYDWNQGFKTETGDVFPGGAVNLQSQLFEK